jgi:hypothetical protein
MGWWQKLGELAAALPWRRSESGRVAVACRHAHGLACVGWEVVVGSKGWGEVVRGVAGSIGAAGRSLGGPVGCVRIVEGEEPVLWTLAPRLDLVAESAVAALARPSGHYLWLSLAPGAYLAQVIDPSVPLAGGEAELAAAVAGRSVRCALSVRFGPSGRARRVVLAAYGRRGTLREAIAAAAPFLGPLSALVTASTKAPAAPKLAVKSKL